MGGEPDFPDANCVENCVWHIPICGGFCAPTTNPNETPCRHFSNEWTPPQPCFRNRFCRGWCEHSLLVRLVGRVGFDICNRYRASILSISVAVSFMSWIFLVFAASALTSSQSVLEDTHWIKATFDGDSAEAFFGLSHILVQRAIKGDLGGDDMVRLENTCGEGLPYYSKTYDDELVLIEQAGDVFFNTDCDTCKKAARSSVSLAISACITQVFQMTTALQRTTRFGDLNCQKFMGIATGIYGLVSTLYSLRIYRKECGLKGDMPEWNRSVDVDAILVSTGEEVVVSVRLIPGLAFKLLISAVWLKCLDILCHLLIPIPHAKQLHPKKGTPEDSNFEAYLLTGVITDQPLPKDDDAPGNIEMA